MDRLQAATRATWLPSAIRALAELPLAVGVVFGLGWSWLYGAAFVLDGRIEGYGWPAYTTAAWAYAQGEVPRYDYFHGPLFGYFAGNLGEAIGSYPHAIVLVCSGLVAAAIVAIGLGARALGGPWAGGLAAAALPMTAHAADMTRWANGYPVLSAFTALSLGLAVATARWPRVGLALLTGICVGLCSVADSRGVLVLPVALVLVIMGATQRRRRFWLILPLVFGLGLSSRPAVHHALSWNSPLSLAQRVHTQRRVVKRWVDIGGDRELVAGCLSIAEDEFLTRTYVESPCAPAMVRHNLTQRLPWHLPLGGTMTLLGSLLVLLPAGRGRRGVLEGGVLLLGTTLPLFALFAITPMVDRYMVQVAGPAVLLPAAGFGRLACTVRLLLAKDGAQGLRRALGLLGRTVPAALAVAVLFFAWRTDPARRHLTTALQRNPRTTSSAAAVDEIRRLVTRHHDALLDCTEIGTAVPLLPWVTHEVWHHRRAPEYRLNDAMPCLEWMRSPPNVPGTAYLAVQPGKTTGSREGKVVIADAVAATPGWSEVWSDGPVSIWAHEANGAGD